MRKNWMLAMAVVTLSVTAAVGAQSAKGMAKPSKGDTMSATYTGCVESVNHGGAFLLTKAAESMHGDMMAGEKMDAMAAKSFNLAGSVNLSKHVGQKVAITGSVSEGSMGTMREDVSTLTVKTLKVVSKSCS